MNAPVTASAAPVAGPAASARGKEILRALGMLPVLVLLCVGFGLGTENFASLQNLSIITQTTGDFASNTTLDTLASTLSTALTTLRTQASSLGSQLSIVQTRQDFTKAMVNTLQIGADNLVLADTNEEGANMLALQTRQSLSTTALSLASQADQNVLRLFG